MTKQFSINSNFYFSRRCQEDVRVSGPSEKGGQSEDDRFTSFRGFEYYRLVSTVIRTPVAISRGNPRHPAEPLFHGLRGCAQLLFQHHFTRSDRKSTRLNSSHLGISYAVF